jgi:phosphotransferase system enzyme I (PtsP)
MNIGPKNWSLLTEASSETREKASSEFMDAQIALSAPRRLMANLRDIMAEEESSEIKLNRIIALIAKEVRGDVCSCFILRAGEVLELFSSIGLPPEIVRVAKVRVGDGIAGDIAASAAPLVLPDIRVHPQYVPRPETGDGKYRSFCGVPVLRGGRVRGVLLVQNLLPRGYGEEVIEILQTVAMIVAELIIAGGLVSRLEINSGFASGEKPTHIEAVSLGRGIAVGTAVIYEPGLSLQDIVADDAQLQKKRLHQALGAMHDAIDSMLSRNAALSGTESRDILEAYQMFAKDRGWLARIETAIDKGLSAEAAVQRVQSETRARMTQMSDSYIRERLHDLEDLSNRLLSHLVRQNKAQENPANPLPESIVLVARSMGPAALLDYDHTRLKAVVLEKGSYSNHVAIVARSLGIPIVGQCGDIYNFLSDGDQVIVDGDQGSVYINPSEYIVDLYARSMEARVRRSTLYRRHAQQKCITKDGVKVSVMINAGLLAEVSAVQGLGADGIGLFRTELSFMGWKKYPLVVTQAELYGKILDQMGDKPVVFRTLDIGGDKPLPYFTVPAEEENPALGWRAVRIGMDRPAVLRTQFRAFIRGSRGRNLKIMLPFVTEVAEFDRARLLLEMEKTRARQNGITVPEKIELGVMLEVPALLWQMDAVLQSVDFISVGTNDLMQYIYAVDRGNHAMRNRYDCLSPAMLKVLKTIADQCKAAGKPVSVCGEMAGQPLEAMVLVALGYDTLSVPAQSVEAIKTLVPTIDNRILLPYLDQLILSREHSLRERLTSFARDHAIIISETV